MPHAQPPVIPTPASRRLAVFLKLAAILVLIVLLQIPLWMTDGVLQERRAFRTQATEDISRLWGRDQLVVGPVLSVPYAYRTKVMKPRIVDGRVVQVEEMELVGDTAYFLPETLMVDGEVRPEVRRRGIYETVVYAATLRFEGAFRAEFAAAGIGAERIYWEKARVHFGISDLHGLRTVGPLRAGGKSMDFEATALEAGNLLPLSAGAPVFSADGRAEFAFEAILQGSERLEIAPLGKTTRVALASPWPDPSFVGASLPATRHVGEDGFKAEWVNSQFNRGFGQHWTTRGLANDAIRKLFAPSAFGVRFMLPLDHYGMAERARKYGVLFLVLVFAVFFLFEVTGPGLRIHPLQYALVGAALALFFLAFLALSELLPTPSAYLAAAGACTLLVAFYAWSFLRTGGRTLLIAGGLGATYGLLYFVLQSQDYALLAGTVALFAVLALVMFFTRRVDWYALEGGGETKLPASAD